MRERTAWIIRPQSEDDVEPTIALLAEAAREGHGIATEWPFDVNARARALRQALAQGRVIGWLASDNGEIVGHLLLSELADEPLVGLIVAASHRQRGIGRALLDTAITWARDNGKPALRLRVFPDNAPALALYRAAGFVEGELERNAVTRSDGSALDVLQMRRALTPGT